jgi:kumamolisin
VLACGGTTLLGKNGGIVDEFVWMDGIRRLGGGGTTGGGVSEHVPRPEWQSSRTFNIPVSKSTGFAGRGVPDVAANADPRTGYIVRVDGWDAIDAGTSAAAPLWAALIARVNEQLSKTVGGKAVGYFNPLLYTKLGGSPAFNDIVSGTNDALGTLGAYNAGPGWDACTGWGSPHGINLLAALTGTAAPVTEVARGEHPGLAEVLGAPAKLTVEEELKAARAKVQQLIETVKRMSKLVPNT